MFRNVLVGVDGKLGGRDAIALASRLIDPAGELTLAHVQSGELYPRHALTPARIEPERTASRELLERERESAGVDAELVGVTAISAGRGLHEQAEEQRADLLVVGSCSRGMLGRAMIGDHTRDSLNGASCAVAVAPVGYSAQPTPITKIGVAYNGSPQSIDALARARELAAVTGASIHALEVVSPPPVSYTGIMPPLLGESIDASLQSAAKRMSQLPGVQGEAVYGLPGEELATFGERVDILIAGSRGYGPIKRLVLGSTCSYLQRHARCPLLILARSAATAADGEKAAEVAVSV